MLPLLAHNPLGHFSKQDCAQIWYLPHVADVLHLQETNPPVVHIAARTHAQHSCVCCSSEGCSRQFRLGAAMCMSSLMTVATSLQAFQTDLCHSEPCVVNVAMQLQWSTAASRCPRAAVCNCCHCHPRESALFICIQQTKCQLAIAQNDSFHLQAKSVTELMLDTYVMYVQHIVNMSPTNTC